MSKKSEDKNRLRLIYFLILGLIPLLWTFINSYFDWGLGAVQYGVLGIVSIIAIYSLPKVGINVKGIDDNWKSDILIGIGLGFLLIFLKILNLVGSFEYGAGLFSIRIFGAGLIETSIFFIVMIAVVFKIGFKEKDNGWAYFFTCLIVGFIFAFFHYAFITQATTGIPDESVKISLVSGFFISATIIAMIWGYVLKWTKSALPLIISHMMLNFYMLNKTLHWINLGINSMIIPWIHNLILPINNLVILLQLF
ncbi:MAG: CPBP family glutamic-type intramembrane protease [archaeon]|jgi:membrane protease YdiL (CAAX protease family)